MPGDVGLVAALLTKAFGFVVDPNGYQELSRENKLKWLMRGINDALATNNLATADGLFNEYRELYQQVGP
jgi:hypothetical protein